MKLHRALAAGTLAALLALPAFAGQASTRTGWITDEHCGAEGAKAGHKDCAEKCVGKGYKLVFYDQGEKKIYKLDDQATAKSHLGYEVKVTGTVEGDALKVEKIEKAAA